MGEERALSARPPTMSPHPTHATPDHPPRLGWRPGLDGLRGYAVLAVIAFHFSQRDFQGSSVMFPGGAIGVDVFFVLSGFLITYLLLYELRTTGSVDLRRFYVRRALRLLPAFVAMFFGFSIVVVAFDDHDFTGPRAAPLLLDNMFYVLTYSLNWLATVGGERVWGIGHLWSLAVEEQFYLVWPPALVLLWRLGRWPGPFIAVASVLLVSSASMPLWIDNADHLYFGTDARAHQLLAGAVLAQLFVSGRFDARTAQQPTFRLALGISAIVLVAVVLLAADRNWYLLGGGLVLVTVAATIVVAGVVFAEGRWWSVLLTNRALIYLGKRSYALYLWHYPIGVWWERLELAGRVVVPLALSIALAEISYRLVEEPALRLKDRLWTTSDSPRRRSSAPAPAGGVVQGT